MSFIARIDAARWRGYARGVAEQVARVTGSPVVPVVKGNGYGLGQELLAGEAAALGVPSVAVGTVFETAVVLDATHGDVIVLEPFEPADAAAADAWWHASKRADGTRIVRTVASLPALLALADGTGPVRVLLEARSSMHRFGFDEASLLAALADSAVRAALARGSLVVEGLSLHLPLDQPADAIAPRGASPATAKVREAMRWLGTWQAETASWSAAGAPAPALWVSHLDDAELAALAAEAGGISLRARSGTRLWLGDRGAIRAAGTVLAVHDLPDGAHVGYRQRSGRGTLVVVSGGTAHGIGLSAPSPAASLRQRIVTAGTGALDAAGRARSPFRWAGEQRWFAEPPHQQHSLIWIPAAAGAPSVGEELDAQVRFTTSRFDAVVLA